MAYRSNLPSLSLSDAAWDEGPPDPLAQPDFYDGLVLRRSIGFLVDATITWSLNICLGIAFWLAGLLTFGLLWPVGVLALAILPFAYHTYFIGSRGATPGMALFDVELRSWTGAPVDYLQAFLQTALFYTTVPMTSGLVLLVALFNDRRRTLHDILAGTVMVRTSRVMVNR